MSSGSCRRTLDSSLLTAASVSEELSGESNAPFSRVAKALALPSTWHAKRGRVSVDDWPAACSHHDC
jgi:hypothetical protein